jgi:hypothetical protein
VSLVVVGGGSYGLKKIGHSTAFCERFFMVSLEENYFGREILVKVYDKTKGKTSFFRNF